MKRTTASRWNSKKTDKFWAVVGVLLVGVALGFHTLKRNKEIDQHYASGVQLEQLAKKIEQTCLEEPITTEEIARNLRRDERLPIYAARTKQYLIHLCARIEALEKAKGTNDY